VEPLEVLFDAAGRFLCGTGQKRKGGAEEEGGGRGGKQYEKIF